MFRFSKSSDIDYLRHTAREREKKAQVHFFALQ